MEKAGVLRCRDAAIWIGLLALLPVVLYALFGYTGQDLPFHVTSWIEVKDAWLSGHVYPGWSDGANFTLGDPHFCFYPPVSFLIGGVLSLLLPIPIAPAVFVWLALLVAGLSMYFAARRFVAERDRLWVAAFYMFNPYLMTTAMVRFAAAELLVQAILPWIVLCFYRAVQHKDDRATLLLGALLGLGWLTNVPAAIVLLYTLLPTAIFWAGKQRSATPVLRVLFAECIAGALAACYLLPTWAERGSIHWQALVDTDPRRLLLFVPQPAGSAASLTYLCWLFACLGVLMIAACLWNGNRKISSAQRNDPAFQTWCILAGIAIFLQLPLASLLWQYLPQLRSVHYPFRFLPFLFVTLPLLLFHPATRPSLRRPVGAVLLGMTLLAFLGYLTMQAIPANRTAKFATVLDRWSREGFPGTPEAVPVGAVRPKAAPHIVPVGVVAGQSAPDCHVLPGPQERDVAGAPRRFRMTSSGGCRVRLALYYYPYWQARSQQSSMLPTSMDNDGMLLVDIPAGDHTVSLHFHAASKLRTGSNIASGFTLLFLFVAFAFWRPSQPTNRSIVFPVTGVNRK